jgi:hypothetical protein
MWMEAVGDVCWLFVFALSEFEGRAGMFHITSHVWKL